MFWAESKSDLSRKFEKKSRKLKTYKKRRASKKHPDATTVESILFPRAGNS